MLAASAPLIVMVLACAIPPPPTAEEPADPVVEATGVAGDDADEINDRRSAAADECPSVPGAIVEHVDRETMGDEWPLTVDDGCLYCEPFAGTMARVFFTTGEETYRVNGLATRYPNIDPIWAWSSDPLMVEGYETCLRAPGASADDCFRVRHNIGPLVARGLALCAR